MTRETFALALIDKEPHHGWLVEATSAGDAVDFVHKTKARNRWRSELVVSNEAYYQERHLNGGPFPDSWTRFAAPRRCPACGHGFLINPGGATRCMVEVDAGNDGLILEQGRGYHHEH